MPASSYPFIWHVAMRLAIDEAWRYQLLTYPNPAVGACVLDAHGAPIAVAAHRQAGGPHAEVRAIRDAYVALSGDRTIAACEESDMLHDYLKERAGKLFSGHTIVVTLEPCAHHGRTPACADLIGDLGFERVVIGTMDPNPVAAGGAARLRRRGIEVVTGIEKRGCEELLSPFEEWSREGRLVVFKLAQSLNGVIGGGTISCESSRRWVHRLRTRIDWLVVGGETVRVDRPKLDSRLVGGKAPDVAILTRRPDSIDRSIPLFEMPDRRVDFVQSLPPRGLVMVEGGGGTLEALRRQIDWMVLFVAPFVKEGIGYNGTKDFRLMHQRRVGRDAMLWLKAKHG